VSSNEQTGLRAKRAEPVGGGGVPAQPSALGTQPTANLPYPVEVHIEELVLHGFESAERYAIGEIVQRELTRLFAEQGTPSTLGHDSEIARISAGTPVTSVGSDARALGTQIAQSVYRSLNGDA
jgi:hypothetical protein